MMPFIYDFDDDPFFTFIGLAEDGGSLSNNEMDEIIYDFSEIEAKE